MFRGVVKVFIKPVFQCFGVEVVSFSTPKPTQIHEDLEKVLSLKSSGIPTLYECPLDYCVIQNGFSFSETGWHPFVAAYEEMHVGAGDIRFRGSFLQKYYNTWAPDSSRDAIAGFNDSPKILESVASYTLHVPWMEASPEDRQAYMKRIILDENRAAGYPLVPAKEGYGLHGPVSDKKGEIEFNRLVSIYNSINTNGYDRTRSDGDVSAIAIEYNGEFRFCVMDGQHRVAAAKALGFKTLPVDVKKVVHYSEIRHWPQVYRGFWSERQAQKFIEHLFLFDSKAWAIKMNLNRGSR